VLCAALLGTGGALAGPGLTGATLTDAVAVGATASSIGTYDQRVKSLSPLAYWRMDEASTANGATLVDSSGKGANGTYVAGDLVYTAYAPSYTSSMGNAYQYRRLSVNAAYTFAAGDRFEYDVFLPAGSETDGHVGVDFELTDGLAFRSYAYNDQNGISNHPDAWGVPRGSWQHRVFVIGAGTPLVGKTVSTLMFAAEGEVSTPQTARFSNIRVTDVNGGIKKSFWAAGDPLPTLTSAHAVNPPDATATLTSGTSSARVAGAQVIYGGGVGAAAFGGNANGATIPSPTLDMGAGASFSVEVWVNSSQLDPAGSALVSREVAGHQEQYALDYYQGATRFYVRTADGTPFVSSGPNINDGKWHHLVGVLDNGTVTMYVDGVAAPSAAGVTGRLLAMPAGTPTTIGTRLSDLGAFTGPNGLVGAVDELAIYGRALTAAEVKDHFAHH
jgi:hypothetical protein